jgi:hypothetical protein
MSNNPDMLQQFARGVVFQYPKVNCTYRFNSAEKKSEPCAPGVQGAAWSIGWNMKADEAKKMIGEMKAHYEACRSRNKKLPEFVKVFGVKKNEDGTVSFAAKKRGMNNEGKANKPPQVVDYKKEAIPQDKLDFWSGSEGNIRFIAFPTVDPDGVGGISLLLDAVQVTKPVYGSANLDGFDVVEPADDFSSVAASTKAAGKQESDLF